MNHFNREAEVMRAGMRLRIHRQKPGALYTAQRGGTAGFTEVWHISRFTVPKEIPSHSANRPMQSEWDAVAWLSLGTLAESAP